jgi:hypothetical protein
MSVSQHGTSGRQQIGAVGKNYFYENLNFPPKNHDTSRTTIVENNHAKTSKFGVSYLVNRLAEKLL